MYIRQKAGRDRGKAIDMRDEEARAMIKMGSAIAVDFDVPNALDLVVDFDVHDQQTGIAEIPTSKPHTEAEPAVMAEAPSDRRIGDRLKRKITR